MEQHVGMQVDTRPRGQASAPAGELTLEAVCSEIAATAARIAAECERLHELRLTYIERDGRLDGSGDDALYHQAIWGNGVRCRLCGTDHIASLA